MSEPYWEPLAGSPGPIGPPGAAGVAGAQGPAGAAGTIPNRLGVVCETITDWNSAKDNGWYMAANAANAPVAGVWFYGQTIQHNPSWVTQIVYQFAGDYRAYIRHMSNGTWVGWQPFAGAYQTGMFQTGGLSNDTQYGWNIWFPVAFPIAPRAVMLTVNNWTALQGIHYAATNYNPAYFDLYVYNQFQGGNYGIQWIAFA